MCSVLVRCTNSSRAAPYPRCALSISGPHACSFVSHDKVNKSISVLLFTTAIYASQSAFRYFTGWFISHCVYSCCSVLEKQSGYNTSRYTLGRKTRQPLNPSLIDGDQLLSYVPRCLVFPWRARLESAGHVGVYQSIFKAVEL